MACISCPHSGRGAVPLLMAQQPTQGPCRHRSEVRALLSPRGQSFLLSLSTLQTHFNWLYTFSRQGLGVCTHVQPDTAVGRPHVCIPSANLATLETQDTLLHIRTDLSPGDL